MVLASSEENVALATLADMAVLYHDLWCVSPLPEPRTPSALLMVLHCC